MTEPRPDYRAGSSEHDEQVALFDWVRRMRPSIPELELFHAIPNGGHRNKAVAAKMQREGVLPGVLDTFLPVFRYSKKDSESYSGMYIEMKFGRNKLTDAQRKFKDGVEKQGFMVAVCYDAEEAIAVLCDYLGLDQDWQYPGCEPGDADKPRCVKCGRRIGGGCACPTNS